MHIKQLAGFPTQKFAYSSYVGGLGLLLKDAIFRERQWEFFMEGYRREDLIRQGQNAEGDNVFIETIKYSHAKSRQNNNAELIDVKECNKLYPIHNIERSLNTNITQNDCY